MDNLQQLTHKVEIDAQHLKVAVEQNQIDLALATAKRARRNVSSLVRQLAEIRDNATANGGTSND